MDTSRARFDIGADKAASVRRLSSGPAYRVRCGRRCSLAAARSLGSPASARRRHCGGWTPRRPLVQQQLDRLCHTLRPGTTTTGTSQRSSGSTAAATKTSAR